MEEADLPHQNGYLYIYIYTSVYIYKTIPSESLRRLKTSPVRKRDPLSVGKLRNSPMPWRHEAASDQAPKARGQRWTGEDTRRGKNPHEKWSFSWENHGTIWENPSVSWKFSWKDHLQVFMIFHFYVSRWDRQRIWAVPQLLKRTSLGIS